MLRKIVETAGWVLHSLVLETRLGDTGMKDRHTDTCTGKLGSGRLCLLWWGGTYCRATWNAVVFILHRARGGGFASLGNFCSGAVSGWNIWRRKLQSMILWALCQHSHTDSREGFTNSPAWFGEGCTKSLNLTVEGVTNSLSLTQGGCTTSEPDKALEYLSIIHIYLGFLCSSQFL